MLQGDRGHPHKSIRMDGAPLRYFFVLKPDEIASQCTIRRIAPGVDVDRLIVDALRIHVDEALRITQSDVTRQVALRLRGQRRVLNQIPDLRYETVGVCVDCLHPAARDEQLATLTRCDADLRQSKTGRCSGSSRDVFQEVSAIGHFLLHRIGSPTVAAVYDRRQSNDCEIAGGHRPPLQFPVRSTFSPRFSMKSMNKVIWI